MSGPIIIFDGVCNLCNGVVDFVIRRDPSGVFKFTPMQSDFAKQLMIQHNKSIDSLDTFLLIQNGVCYERSDAALNVTKQLTGPCRHLSLLRVMPKLLRDVLYNFIARHRYRFFGQRAECRLPEPELNERFIFGNTETR